MEKENERMTFVSSECAVKKITVYSDRAEVCRILETDVRKGVNEVVLKQLPTCIDPDSIRVEGKGLATIVEVSYQMKYLPKDEAEVSNKEKELNIEIETLKKERSELQIKLDVTNKQTEVLYNLAKTVSTANSNKNASPPVLDTTFFKGVRDLLQLVGEQGNGLASESLTIDRQLTVLNDKISAASENLNKLRGPGNKLQESRECTIVLECEEKAMVVLFVSYVVSRAAWIPSYDIRMYTTEGTMKIFYYGQIRQSTGEDWNNAKLFLSTASPSVGGVVPELAVQHLSIKQKFVPCLYKSRNRLMKRPKTLGGEQPWKRLEMAGLADGAVGDIMCLDISSESDHVETDVGYMSSQVKETTTSATYEIARLSSVPSDGVEHKVSVGILEIKPTLEYISLPKTAPSAFLRARVTNTSQFTLLPGPTSIFLDNSFVAKATIKAVSPGEEFECSLGVDPAVKITYKPLSKFRESSGIFSKTVSTKYKQVTEVRNAHDYPVTLELHDQLPRSTDEKIKVALLEPTIDLKHPEKKASVQLKSNNHVVWLLNLDKQEKREVTLRYSIEHPASEEISTTEVCEE